MSRSLIVSWETTWNGLFHLIQSKCAKQICLEPSNVEPTQYGLNKMTWALELFIEFQRSVNSPSQILRNRS